MNGQHKTFQTPIDRLIEIHYQGTVTLRNLLEAKKDEQQTIIAAYKQGETDREDDMLHQVRTYESGIDYYASMYQSKYETIEEAKTIEKNQLIHFAMAAYQNISRLKGVPESLISENKYLFEDYFQKWENEK